VTPISYARMLVNPPGLKPHLFTHQSFTVPSAVPPSTGSAPSLFLKAGPPQMLIRLSSHLHVKISIRFMPLASAISIGGMCPRKREVTKEDTREMREVASYTSGFIRRIFKKKKKRNSWFSYQPEMIEYILSLKKSDCQ